MKQKHRIMSAVFTGSVMLGLIPATAEAHPIKGVGDFYAGMLHPILTIEQLLPLIALSLLAGQQKRESAIDVLIAFPLALAAGACIGLYHGTASFADLLDVAAMVGLGGLVAAAWRGPRAVPLALALVLGLNLGWVNGGEVGPSIAAYRFIAGLMLAGLLLTAYGIGLVRGLKAGWTQIAIRAVGSWIAAIGVMVLAVK